MDYHYGSHRSRDIIAASGIALIFGGHALAQTVQVFENPPSFERLRSIMILELPPNAGRTTVILRSATGPPPDHSAAIVPDAHA